jgi:hypothetical protein
MPHKLCGPNFWLITYMVDITVIYQIPLQNLAKGEALPQTSMLPNFSTIHGFEKKQPDLLKHRVWSDRHKFMPRYTRSRRTP